MIKDPAKFPLVNLTTRVNPAFEAINKIAPL
jgi:hypothetical protein